MRDNQGHRMGPFATFVHPAGSMDGLTIRSGGWIHERSACEVYSQGANNLERMSAVHTVPFHSAVSLCVRYHIADLIRLFSGDPTHDHHTDLPWVSMDGTFKST